MSKYIRVTDGLKDKGKLIPLEKFKNDIKTIKSDRDLYASVYYYNEEQFKKFNETGSISGINDTVTDRLVFDFDSKENLEDARKDALELFDRLKKHNINEDDVYIFFSGKKGFTVEFNLNKEITPDKASSLALNYFGKNLKTLDSSIYNASRILRVPNTKHQDSGLYKIQISYNQLKRLPIDMIKKRAENPQMFFNKDFKYNLKDEQIVVENKTIKPTPTKQFNVLDKPRYWKDYKWAIAQGMYEPGERHNALIVLAATCRGLGYDREQAIAFCNTSLKKQMERTGSPEFNQDELENDIIQSVYSDKWQGGQYSPKNNSWLRLFCERLGLNVEDDSDNEPKQITDITDGFADYVMNIEQNTIKTGLDRIDKAMPITTGMNLGIVGSPSAGKTAIALEILKNTSSNGVVSVFASLDMHRNRLFEKLLYKVSGGKLSREQIYDLFKKDKNNYLVKKIKEEYGNVYFYDRSSPTVKDLRQYIESINETTGKKVKLLMVDYFERVNSERSDDTAASKDVAGQLQDLMNDYNLALITLVQPNKMSLGAGPDSPILSYTAIKGSSFLYQSFRSIISLWRPFFNPQWKDHDKFIQMAILKNDLGELNTFDYAFEGKTGTIREMFPEEEAELKELLAIKEQQKDKKSDDGWGN